MKKLYTQLLAVAGLFLSVNVAAQSVPIYATTTIGTSGAEITSAANGAGTYMGDQIVLAGTERYLDNIVVRVFNLTSDAPFVLTMRLYTDCMSSAAGCGAGPGTLIAGSEVVVPVTPTVGVGTIFTVTIPFNGLDLSAEADNSIAVMMNASRGDVFWVLNETVATGSTPTGEAAASVVIRCGSTVAANNGCTRAFTNAINNFSMTVNASANLGLETAAGPMAVAVYPNPAQDYVNVSSQNGISRVTIIDIAGRTVKDTKFDHQVDVQVDLSAINSGNYIIKIESLDGIAVKKLVKL